MARPRCRLCARDAAFAPIYKVFRLARRPIFRNHRDMEFRNVGTGQILDDLQRDIREVAKPSSG
jgi:hypothetical protein